MIAFPTCSWEMRAFALKKCCMMKKAIIQTDILYLSTEKIEVHKFLLTWKWRFVGRKPLFIVLLLCTLLNQNLNTVFVTSSNRNLLTIDFDIRCRKCFNFILGNNEGAMNPYKICFVQ